MIRNVVCGLLALALIASGRVRRQRRRALSGDVITAIYFHKPGKRLFAQCVEWLTRYGYTFITAADLINHLYRGARVPKGAVWLSFDDGCRELLSNVLPLIRERNIPITLFIPSGIVMGDGLFPWTYGRRRGGRDAITLAELRDLAACPQVTIGGHTVSHAITAGLEREQTRFELEESKHSLESWTGASVKCFAYPAGRSDGREHELLRELGYLLATTTDNAFVSQGMNVYQVPRFSVADAIWFPEAICNMAGVWRPAIDPVIRLFARFRRNRGRKKTLRSGALNNDPQPAIRAQSQGIQ